MKVINGTVSSIGPENVWIKGPEGEVSIQWINPAAFVREGHIVRAIAKAVDGHLIALVVQNDSTGQTTRLLPAPPATRGIFALGIRAILGSRLGFFILFPGLNALLGALILVGAVLTVFRQPRTLLALTAGVTTLVFCVALGGMVAHVSHGDFNEIVHMLGFILFFWGPTLALIVYFGMAARVQAEADEEVSRQAMALLGQ